MTLVSLDLIKARLAEDVDRLVPMLFPNARIDGRYWRLGSIHGEPGQSMAINRTGARRGQWKDFGSDEHGSMLDLVAQALCGGDIREAVKRGRELAGLGQITPEELRAQERRAEAARLEAERRAAARAEKVQASAQRIFYYESLPLAGSPAEAYLAGRGIRMAELAPKGRWPSALRFHPALLHPETQRKHPSLVALVMGLDGKARGIHRTFLQIEPHGRVIKLQGVEDQKLSLGPIKGGHIPLWRGGSDQPVSKMPDGEWILLTEGIEDALSAAYEIPHVRIWAGISLTNMGALDLPRGCAGLWWHRHRDGEKATAAALRAQEKLSAHWAGPIRDIWAPEPFKDFNEARQAADLARFAATGAMGGASV